MPVAEGKDATSALVGCFRDTPEVIDVLVFRTDATLAINIAHEDRLLPSVKADARPRAPRSIRWAITVAAWELHVDGLAGNGEDPGGQARVLLDGGGCRALVASDL